MYCLQTRGVGLHKSGEACDFQAGARSRYSQSVAVHQSIANYTLANWARLRVRYMAWNGYEWLGNASRRRQVKNYGGSDPFHQNHVHVDFLPGSIPGANPSVPIGGGGSPATPPPSTTPGVNGVYYTGAKNGSTNAAMWRGWQFFLNHRGYYGPQPNSKPDATLWKAVQEFLRDYGYYTASSITSRQDSETGKAVQRWLKRTNNYTGSINGSWNTATWTALQKYLSYATIQTGTATASSNTDAPAQTGPTPTPPPATTTKKDGPFMALSNAQQASMYKQTMNISAAVNRNEQRGKSLLTMINQTNEILLGILAQLSDTSNPDSALSDLVFRANAQEVAHDAGMAVYNYDPPLDADPYVEPDNPDNPEETL